MTDGAKTPLAFLHVAQHVDQIRQYLFDFSGADFWSWCKEQGTREARFSISPAPAAPQ